VTSTRAFRIMARGLGKARGFTLIELLVVISLLAIMAALAAPSMSQLIAGQRVRAFATDLHLVLVMARTEAIKRNASVTLAPVGGDWNAGWTVADPAGGATPLDSHGPSANVSVTSAVTQVVFGSTGRATIAPAGGASTFIFTSPTTSKVRCVSIDSTGRPYVKEAATC